jgi:hypothetical protein
MATQANISIWAKTTIIMLAIKTALDYGSKRLKP